MLAEINRNRKKRARPFTPQDFMPGQKKREKALTPEQMKERLRYINMTLGGKEIKKDGK